MPTVAGQHPAPRFRGFAPFIRPDSRILVLGSFPSVKSREQGFYYGHPQNRFWKTLAAVFGDPVPFTIPEKKSLLARRRIALWDMAAECEIEGSMDADLRNIRVVDLAPLLRRAPIGRPERPQGGSPFPCPRPTMGGPRRLRPFDQPRQSPLQSFGLAVRPDPSRCTARPSVREHGRRPPLAILYSSSDSAPATGASTSRKPLTMPCASPRKPYRAFACSRFGW